MRSVDYRDIMTGAVLCAGGLLVAWYSASNHSLGAGTRLGSGSFPFAVGLILAGFGAAIGVVGFFKAGPPVKIEWRAAVVITLGVGAFAVVIDTLGFVPAIVALTLIAAMADRRPRLLGAMALAGFLGVVAFVIFRLALGLPLVPFRWPF